MKTGVTDLITVPKMKMGQQAKMQAFAPETKWSYAGGYGFWCNQACADSKNQAKKASQDAATAQLNALNALSQPAPPSTLNIGMVAIGSMVAMTTIISIVYFIKR